MYLQTLLVVQSWLSPVCLWTMLSAHSVLLAAPMAAAGNAYIYLYIVYPSPIMCFAAPQPKPWRFTLNVLFHRLEAPHHAHHSPTLPYIRENRDDIKLNSSFCLYHASAT